MDLSGGVLNQFGLEILKKAEGLGKYECGGYLATIGNINKV